VSSTDATARTFLQEQVFGPHKAIDALVIEQRHASQAIATIQERGDAPVAVRRSYPNELSNGAAELLVSGNRVRASSPPASVDPFDEI